MNTLIEIAQVIKSVKISNEDLITPNKAPRTNVQKFYHNLINGDFQSDQEAAQFFFNENSTHSKYKNLKRYLKQKMYNTVFFIEPKKHYGTFNEAYLYCCKKLFTAKILMNLGARKSGVELCSKVFQKALNTEISEFIVESSRYLRLHYGTRAGDAKKFEYYNDYYDQYSKILESERLAELYYIRLTMPLVKSITIDREIIENASKYYQLLQPQLDQYESPILHFYGKYLKILCPLFRNDYLNLIKYCHEAIDFFEGKRYTYVNPLRVFYHNLIVGYTQLKMYEEGKIAVEKASDMVLSGTHSWYANKELHLILAFHAREYNEAIKIIDSAYSHKKFKLLDQTVIEKWSVYQAYGYFLMVINEATPSSCSLRKFKLGKFLNNIPVYSQDKYGLNIPVLIIQIALRVIRKEYGKTIDQFDAVKKYVTRYIKKKQNFRSYCFIQMLLTLPASNFNKTALLRKSQKWYDQLRETPLEVANQPHEIEIIPYEDLWKYIVQSIDHKFYYLKQ